MSPSPQLAAAGSSSYNSNSMTVGDGTWDSTANTFLLPNLVGLNLETMRYNGMGNRFRQQPGYFSIIRAHGIIAAIVFLLIVPSAILTIRFHRRDSRMGVRVHIWLQILTVLLATVVFILGWFAVGPSRKLSNPHHGIGLAIYILVLLQTIGGWWIHRRQKKNKGVYEPLKAMLHHWLGRGIALLGLAQIPLGLTVYGSPAALFALYALAVFALLVTYFILTYIEDRGGGSDYGSRYSYTTGSVADDRRHGRSGNVLKSALAGAGAFALADRLRRRSKGRDGDVAPEVVGSRRHSGSYLEDEKYSQHGRAHDQDGVWEDRMLRIAAPIGLGGLVTRYFDRRYQDRDSDNDSYGPPLGGASAINQNTHGGVRPVGAAMNPDHRMPAAPIPYGRPPQTGPTPLNQPTPEAQHPLNRSSTRASSVIYSDYQSAANEPRRSHGIRDGIATLGVLGLARSIFNKRKDRKKERFEDEQDVRARNQHFTGDRRPTRHHGHHGHGTSSISSDTSLTGISHHPENSHGIPPVPAGSYPNGPGVFVPAFADEERQRRRQTEAEALPLGGVPRPVSMPLAPPDPQGLFHPESSGSESYVSTGGVQHHQHHTARDTAVAGAAGGAAGFSAAEASSNRRDRQDRHQSSSAGEDSTPVSVKVKLHNDGRAVTLSRLPPAEAARQREERRAARSGRGGTDTASSLSSDGGGNRYRRREAQERQNAEAMRIESERLADARKQASNQNIPLHVPPPPPIPESSGALYPGGAGSVGSPGTHEGAMTDTSDYTANRRRRRAERAAQKAGGKPQKTVGFE